MNINFQKMRMMLVVQVMAIAAVIAISLSVVPSGFDRVEQQAAKKDVRTMLNSLEEYLKQLHNKVHDWATWDNTYFFMQDHNQAFIDAYIAKTGTFSGLKIHFIIFVDTDGKIFFKDAYNYLNDTNMPVPALFRQPLPADSAILQHHPGKTGIHGIYPSSEGYLLLAALPILRSDGSGPARGTLIFGHLLDKSITDNLTHLSGVRVTIFSLQDAGNAEVIHKVTNSITDKNPIVIDTPGPDLIAGYALIHDLEGNAKLMGQIVSTRPIHAVASQTLQVFIYLILGVGVVTLLVSIVLLKKLSQSKREKGEVDAQLLYQQNYDELTGLPNHKQFIERLTLVMKRARRSGNMMGVMLLDIARSHELSSMLGVEGISHLVEAITQRLQKTLRDEDALSREEGKGFFMVAPEVNSIDEVAMVAKRVQEILAPGFLIAEKEIVVDIRLGIAVFPVDGDNPKILTDKAGLALGLALGDGTGSIIFHDQQMSSIVKQAQVLRANLRKAVEKQAFELQYQPCINVSSGHITSLEALLRWPQPNGKFMYPEEFISEAESSNLIVPIGDWVLRTACFQNKRWQESSLPPVRVAVNLSTRQFDMTLVDKVRRVLEESGLPPRYLELEITESLAMRDPEQTNLILKSLRKLGVSIAIDDFGTGYSALSYLIRFDVQVLKIDQSFLKLGENNDLPEQNQMVITSIINLAHNLGLTVVAEGIETEAQLRFLKNQGCDVVQGFFLHYPANDKEVTQILAELKSTAADGL